MTLFTPEAADDSVRDACALIRAQLAGDTLAAATVAANMSWPEVTAGILAQWLAGIMRGVGAGQEVLDEWQQQAGLR